jgi:isochorismate synthase
VVEDLVREAVRLRAEFRARGPSDALRGRTAALFFEKPSLRTRVTFETGVFQMGGHAIYFHTGLGERETVADMARNLDRWVDGVVAQQAALKVLKRGLDTDAVLARFLRERDILARLSHPNIARLLDADPAASVYLTDLSSAGPGFAGQTLVGASPELLVSRDGATVRCLPFAGSAPRSADPAEDAELGAELAGSAKNRHEHQLVVDTMRAILEPMCSRLEVAGRPQLSRTAAVWHLSTPITGTLREASTTAMDLAVALQPTPAVGGVPTAAAVDLIAELEGDRGFYAGAVGWCDGAGDGRWVVAIRGAVLSADRRTAVATAGGGIVAESDPDDELQETTAKFATVLRALGLR